MTSKRMRLSQILTDWSAVQASDAANAVAGGERRTGSDSLTRSPRWNMHAGEQLREMGDGWNALEAERKEVWQCVFARRLRVQMQHTILIHFCPCRPFFEHCGAFIPTSSCTGGSENQVRTTGLGNVRFNLTLRSTPTLQLACIWPALQRGAGQNRGCAK